MKVPVSLRVYTLVISAILSVSGTRTYSFPVFLVTTEGERETTELRSAIGSGLDYISNV
jgi:hypothetical protein